MVSVHCAPSSAREGKTLGLAITAANAGLGNKTFFHNFHRDLLLIVRNPNGGSLMIWN